LLVEDVILRVNERPISGLMELRSTLTGVAPGSRVPLLVQRGKQQLKLEVVLGNRPDIRQDPGRRLRQMEQMGGPTSRVRDFGAKAASALASVLDGTTEPDIDRQLDALPDPMGLFYRYSLPAASVPRKRGQQ
jgi:hypothetical protein